MKKLSHLFYAVIVALLFLSCAKQSSPMGGPKDEEPPKIVDTDPKMESTNVNPKEVELTFNEFIKLENPTKQIIITPKIKTDEVEFLPVKNRLNIKLNQELEENTTYVFNFQKSIQDITEGNSAENLKLVFSTGDKIDSLKFKGTIAYIFPPKEKEFKDILVGLYNANDTTNLFTDAPYYIGEADSAGRFELSNIKAGRYRAYAWHDDNNSLKAEHRNEAYGFLPDTIQVDDDVEGVHINLFKGDLSDLKINRSGTSGSNYDIILSKPLAGFDIDHPEKNEKLFYRLADKNLRIYHTDLREDSTQININLRDSVGFKVDTTLYATFETSERKKEELEITTNSGKGFLRKIRAELTLNKPLMSINYDSLLLQYDTAGVIPITQNHISLPDSSNRTKLNIDIDIPDSLNYESFTIYAADSTFQDAEGIWNNTKIEATYRKLKEEALADGITGIIATDERPILLYLLNKKDEIVQEKYLTDTNEFEFSDVEAGEYKISAIIDRNKNRKWDPGNYLENKQPEPVYHFYDDETKSYEFVLRGGWTLTDIVIEPRKDSGKYHQMEIFDKIEDINKIIEKVILPTEEEIDNILNGNSSLN